MSASMQSQENDYAEKKNIGCAFSWSVCNIFSKKKQNKNIYVYFEVALWLRLFAT